MRKLLLNYWGIEADESGLSKKINWKWLIYDVAEWVVIVIGGAAGIGAIILDILTNK